MDANTALIVESFLSATNISTFQ